jgi:hypothetical protein
MHKTTALLAFVALAGACDDADTLTRAESIASLTERVVALEADRADLGIVADIDCTGKVGDIIPLDMEPPAENYAGLVTVQIDTFGFSHAGLLHHGRDGLYVQCDASSWAGYTAERVLVIRIAPRLH